MFFFFFVSLYFQYPELLVASYNNNEDAPHEPDGVALIWNLKYQKESPEYVFHCQVSELLSKIMLTALDEEEGFSYEAALSRGATAFFSLIQMNHLPKMSVNLALQNDAFFHRRKNTHVCPKLQVPPVIRQITLLFNKL